MAKNWLYTVQFARGSSRRTFTISAACIGNAKAVGWFKLEDIEGSRDGWNLSKARKAFEPSEQSDWKYRRAEAGYGE